MQRAAAMRLELLKLAHRRVAFVHQDDAFPLVHRN
jgi:hypothetical protein